MDPEADRRYHMVGGMSVCPGHIEDLYLRQWIVDNPVASSCSFCDRAESTPFAAGLVDFAELVESGVERSWDDLLNEGIPGMGYDSTLSSLELVVELEITDDERLQAALAAALPDNAWVRRGFLSLPPAQLLTYAWRRFTHLIKHQSRFFFPLKERDEPMDPDELSPLELLARLGESLTEAELVTTWPVGTQVFRARVHLSTEPVDHAWDLAALPEDKADLAAANRMSPAGIPMFYGATDSATAQEEALSAESEPAGKIVTTGEFRTLRPLRIVDLSELPEIPSLYDEERADLIPAISFLHAFRIDVAKKVTRDGAEHIDYVPTQVVCEYLRSVHKFDDEVTPVDGIAYRSVQNPDHVNVALFVANDETQNVGGGRSPRPADTLWLGPSWSPKPAVLELVERSVVETS